MGDVSWILTSTGVDWESVGCDGVRVQRTVRIDAALDALLVERAGRDRRAVAEIMRFALEAYLGVPAPAEVRREAPLPVIRTEVATKIEGRHARDQTPPVAESREARQERARKVMAAAEGSKAFYRETVEPITKKGR